MLDIVRRIRPAVEPIIGASDHRNEVVELATRANVMASAQQLRSGSRVLAEQISCGRLLVVGAQYSLATGAVEVVDAPRSVRTVDENVA